MTRISDLKSLRDQLHRVHGVFLDALKYRYERVEGRALAPAAWLGIIMQDPDYAWIRPFNHLVTAIDILLDEETITPEMIEEMRINVESLFTIPDPSPEGESFALRFFEMLPQEPDLLVSYHPFREARKKMLPPQEPKK